MSLTKWLVKRRSDSSTFDKKMMKVAAEGLEKDQEEQRKAHKNKSNKRPYLESQMKAVIRKYAVINLMVTREQSRISPRN